MLVVSLSPGAGAVASLSSGAAHGWPGGIWTALGQQLALLLLLSVAAIGIASLLVSLPWAIPLLSAAGALYLGWIGARFLLAAMRPGGVETASAASSSPALRCPIPATRTGMLWRGFLVNATNPKALLALFVLTPRFIDPARPLLWQYGVIAASMVLIDLVIMSGYTIIGARLSGFLINTAWQRRSDACFGCLFLVAAAFIALG